MLFRSHTKKEEQVRKRESRRERVREREQERAGTGANIAHKGAKQRCQCGAGEGFGARREIFKGPKTLDALRLCSHQ